MKILIIITTLLISLTSSAENQTFESPFEGYIEYQETNSDPSPLAAIGSGFNYQGELLDSGNVVNGNFDFSFQLFDSPTAGNQIGSNVIKGNRTVTGGIFSIEDIDFGNASYTGDALWLSVTVRETGNPGSETTLSPRQKINAVPYAVQAEFGAGNSPWVVTGSDIGYSGGIVGVGTDGSGFVNGTTNKGMMTIGSNISQITFDGDDIQKINSGNPGRLFLNYYGGGVSLSSPTDTTIIRGDLKQPVTQSGVMKYMVDVFCNLPTATITKSYNGVNANPITVTNSPGGCIIDFPTNINDRFFQASPSFASSGNSTSARAVQCRVGANYNQLLCNYFRPNTGDREIGSFMVLIY